MVGRDLTEPLIARREEETHVADLGPDRGSTTGTPRWVKVFGIIVLIVVLLLVIMMLAGGDLGGGRHGPGRHQP
jgi:hypothetical protein